jgi:hypothetical protein
MFCRRHSGFVIPVEAVSMGSNEYLNNEFNPTAFPTRCSRLSIDEKNCSSSVFSWLQGKKRERRVDVVL